MDLKGLLDKNMKNPKKFILNMIIVILIGILMMLISNVYKSINLADKKKKEEKSVIEVSTYAPQLTYEEKLKKDLIDILMQIDGVGKVNAMIYFEEGASTVPAYNENNSIRKIEEKDNQGGTRITTENSRNINVVLMNEGTSNKPFIIKEIRPRIGGVIVVAEGAKSPLIKEQIINAVKTGLNIPANKVSVLPMKN
ncbi:MULTISPECIES: stage III sporulation protein AG [unclassified Caloramator]|uniref:stage III sporulation protein AG n=1 Tax=unclassified Caloramator TaxID=2629145 RepID=UPI00237EAB1C|nr:MULTISPECIES: stage III sporulation protein AG [unclassified Caloramator]MDO6354537.1 stage III sporulation protein AG [Caloramator sp. CAR-1]WDU84275.1 stage III sporulation protein AG [Caloramator sp. Dgby_cultured_2]